MVAFLCAILGQGSFFSTVVPNPTGDNGYEEYVRASEMAQTPLFASYRQWLSNEGNPTQDTYYGRPPDVYNTDRDLAIRRKWNDRYRELCGLISAGNRKQVYDPRQTVRPETTFPEVAGFRQLAALEANAAHVAFADGQTGEALVRLEDCFVFGYKISGGSVIIDTLVGIACDATTFNELNDHWTQFSIEDAQEMRHFFGGYLGNPLPIIQSIKGERKACLTALDVVFSQPGSVDSALSGSEPDKATLNAVSKLNPVDAAQLKTDAEAIVNNYFDSLDAVLSGPESGWLKYRDPPDLDSKQSLAARLADVVLPVLSQAILRAAKDRIQFHLAYLTAAAIEYKWTNGRFPDRIEDFTTKEERLDPTSGKNFVYRREGIWFKISREAKDALGGVGLQTTPKPPDPDSLPTRALIIGW